MPRLSFLYPVLFAIIPILNVLSRNPGYASRRDIIMVLGCALVGWLLAYVVVFMMCRRSALRASWLVFLLVLVFYGSVALVSWGRTLGGMAGAAGLALLTAVAAIVVSRWLIHHTPRLEQVSQLLGLTGLLLTIWLSGNIVRDQARERSVVHHSALAKRLAQPIGVVQGKRSPAAFPDIYLLVLDEYANADVLREQFSFDNHVFEDSLRGLGFTIPRAVHSNYAHTTLSLPSLLNFSHLTELTGELGRTATDPTLPNYLLHHNRTVAFLKRQGYAFLFYPSQWWPATRHNPDADFEFEAWHGFSPARELTRTHFRRTITRMTLLGQIFPEPPYDSDHIRRTLEALKAVPARAEPTFAFVHVLNPHYPYVFQADCRPVRLHARQRKRLAYVEQLRCLNVLVLNTVTYLLQHSPTAPVILLQGDHGTSTLNFSWAPSAAAVSPAQARERFGAFGAYYLPAGGNRLLADSVTLVNVLPKVLDYYLGAAIEPAPDDLYMSTEPQPYDFVKVDPHRLVPTLAHEP
jgi:hypothetical protein